MSAIFDVDVDSEDCLADLYSRISVSICRVTPEAARAWLTKNVSNRQLSKLHVKHFVDVMLAGDMIFNGETIIFNADGDLINGQHRLHACVESGRSFDVLVVRGVDQSAFRTLDSGRKRSSADVLYLAGEINASNLAAAVQALVAFVDFGGSIRVTTTQSRKATPQLIDRVLSAHSGLRESVRVMRKSRLYDNQYGYLLHYLFSTVNAKLADDFAEVLANGHTDVGRPFVRLRETMISNGRRTDLRRVYAAKAIKAFNAEMTGARPKMISFNDAREDFPEIVGLDYDAIAEST
jgi:hypothetical protein